MDIEFKTNAQGNFCEEINKYGGGVEVHIQGVILDPDDIYTITIKSSDGGGGHFKNVRAGQKISCNISTSFWHSTNIVITVHSSIPNSTGHARINYSY